MKDLSISKGNLVEIEAKEYRVFFVDDRYIAIINMKFFEIITYLAQDFMKLEFSIVHEDHFSHPIFSEYEISRIRNIAEFFESIIYCYYPNFNNLVGHGKYIPQLKKGASQFGFSEVYFKRMFISYLRSGCNMYVLVDSRRNNVGGNTIRNGDQTIEGIPSKEEQLKEALSIFKKELSVSKAWDYLLKKYYRTGRYIDGEWRNVLLDKEDCITYKVVYKYILNNLGGKTIKEYKIGERQLHNNNRLLSGNMRTGISTIGQVLQVDECEISVSLISSSNRRQVIGKAILYCGFDPWADIITAAKLGFKNNSYSGYCDLILTMLEPHSNQLKDYGVECTNITFPSMYLPKSILVDHGSEYECQELERAMNELGITVKLVPVAEGSEKGGVENCFMRLQHALKKELKKAGYIEPQYNGAEKAKKEACLDIHDLWAIISKLIVNLNTQPLPNYSPDLEMMELGLELTPSNIWNFEGKRSGFPISITEQNKSFILFSLLSTKRKFSLHKKGRAGIVYTGHNLVYFTDEEWYLELIHQKSPVFEVRYNDESVDKIYVKYKNKIHIVPLAEKREELSTFIGLDWNSYDELSKALKNSQNMHQAKSEKLEVSDFIEKTVCSAKKAQGNGKNKIDGIEQARREEKKAFEQNNNTTRNRLLSEIERETFEVKENDKLNSGNNNESETTMDYDSILNSALNKLMNGEELTFEESKVINSI